MIQECLRRQGALMRNLKKEKKIDLSRTSTPYTFQENAARCLWNLVYWLLFRFTPRFFYGWRRFLLRVFGARVGRNVCVFPSTSVMMPWKLSVGDNSVIGPNVRCYNGGGVSLGRDVVISQNTHLCSSSHDYTSSRFALIFNPVYIEDYSWVCADAFVGPGVTVGKGAVVGARSVVVRDVKEWTIVAGNPAKYIKDREILS